MLNNVYIYGNMRIKNIKDICSFRLQALYTKITNPQADHVAAANNCMRNNAVTMRY